MLNHKNGGPHLADLIGAKTRREGDFTHSPMFYISVSPYVAHELYNIKIPFYCKDRP